MLVSDPRNAEETLDSNSPCYFSDEVKDIPSFTEPPFDIDFKNPCHCLRATECTFFFFTHTSMSRLFARPCFCIALIATPP